MDNSRKNSIHELEDKVEEISQKTIFVQITPHISKKPFSPLPFFAVTNNKLL